MSKVTAQEKAENSSIPQEFKDDERPDDMKDEHKDEGDEATSPRDDEDMNELAEGVL